MHVSFAILNVSMWCQCDGKFGIGGFFLGTKHSLHLLEDAKPRRNLNYLCRKKKHFAWWHWIVPRVSEYDAQVQGTFELKILKSVLLFLSSHRTEWVFGSRSDLTTPHPRSPTAAAAKKLHHTRHTPATVCHTLDNKRKEQNDKINCCSSLILDGNQMTAFFSMAATIRRGVFGLATKHALYPLLCIYVFVQVFVPYFYREIQTHTIKKRTT